MLISCGLVSDVQKVSSGGGREKAEDVQMQSLHTQGHDLISATKKLAHPCPLPSERLCLLQTVPSIFVVTA